MDLKIGLWILFLVSQLFYGINCTVWDAGDALIVENEARDSSFQEEEYGTTNAIPTLGSNGNCLTSNGVEGFCIKAKECYPYLYPESVEGGNYRFNFALKDSVMNSSEGCTIRLGGETVSSFTGTVGIRYGEESICCVTLTRAIEQGVRFPQWQDFSEKEAIEAPSKVPEGEEPATRSVCGRSSYVFNPNIVGGRDAKIGEFPYIAAMFYNGRHHCGGSLIDERTVMTAAHCVNNIRSASLLSKVTLFLGAHNIYAGAETGREKRKVKRLIFHKKFSGTRFQDDIALLVLDKPVTYSNRIQPVCLHSGSPAYDGGKTEAEVAGWGKIYDGGPASKSLKAVKIRVWTNSGCSSKYSGTQAPPVGSGMVCAGSPSPARDSCQGDSGGPLTTFTGGRGTQIGVVSWGIGCGQYPGVYTRVDKYHSWIRKFRPTILFV